MVFFNKYLKEIGIDENYWLFADKKIDKRTLPDEEGFVPAEFFNLDTSLALYIYSHLCYFKEHISHIATPSLCYKNGNELDSDKSQKKWDKILNIMIDGFKMLIADDGYIQEYLGETDIFETNKKRDKIIDKGLKTFIEYYHCLWY